jgi:hypothetical protein
MNYRLVNSIVGSIVVIVLVVLIAKCESKVQGRMPKMNVIERNK